jgi:YD repeat-containing protein
MRFRALPGLLVVLLCGVSHVGVGTAQPRPIQYAYDELGRLVAVVDQDGNTAIYSYDAVGNLLSIERVDAAAFPQPVAITAVVPAKGKAGTVVSILGKGFGTGPGQNVVAFQGAGAVVVQAVPNRIIVTVPAGAVTGPISVTAPLGSAVSPRPFRVVAPLAIVPSTVSLGPAQTQQFVISEGGDAADAVWAVAGIVGGNADVGSVSDQGLYTAPLTSAAARTVTVTATSKDDASIVATAQVTLRQPFPTFLAAPPVGVQPVGARLVTAPPVGVQPSSTAAGLTVLAAPVAVSPLASQGFAGISQVTVSFAPLITAISPAAAVRGTTGLTLTLTGSGLGGASGVEFLLNNNPDPAIGVTDLAIAPDGTQATVRISIAAAAAVGPRVVRVRFQVGATTSVGTGANVFTAQ